MVSELEKKYNAKIRTAINNDNSLTKFISSAKKQGEYLVDVGIQAGKQTLRNIANIPNAVEFSKTEKVEIPKAETYDQVGMPGLEKYKGLKETYVSQFIPNTEQGTVTPSGMPGVEKYKQLGTRISELDQYKSVKNSIESQFEYESMPNNTKVAYETVVDKILKDESKGKTYEEQRQLINEMYQNKPIPSFVQNRLKNIDSKETEQALNIENSKQNILEMAEKNADEIRAIEEKYKNEGIYGGTRFAGDILGSIVQMTPYIVVSSVTGGVGGTILGSIAGTGTMYSTVYSSSLAKAISEGANHDQAVQYAHASAMIEAGTEMLSGGIPGAPKGLLSSGIQGKIDDVVKIMVKDGTFRKFISTGVDVFGEGAEEALAEYLGSMALSIYTEDERSDEELTQDMIKAFIMGSVTSATMQMGKYGIIKSAERFVAEKSTDVQNISLEQANDVMNRIALRTQVENFDGLSYKLEDLPKGNNGYIIDGKTIVLNRNQVEESGLIESALPHEMTHALEKVKGYDQLASFVLNLKAKTLGMDLAQLQQVYQEKFDEVHQQAIEMGDTSHQLEIATPDKMARELVAEFIKDNIASRPYKDAQGNIQTDSDGNIITYRNYDALLRLASNQPNMVNKIKKVIRSMIRKSQISEALEFDQTQKADFLIMQEYLESLDGYLNTVLDNADKGLFATEQAQGLQFDTKVLSPNTEQGVKVIRAYESENEQYKGTLEDAQKLLDYSARKGLGFNEVQYEGGTLVRQNNVQLSLDQLKKNDIDVNEVKNVTVEQKPSEVYSREQSLFLNRVYKVEVFKRKDGLYSIYTTDRQGNIVEAAPLTEEQIKNNYGINNANILLSNLGDKTKRVYVEDLDIPRVVITEEEFNRVVKESKKQYGTTNSFVEGGFLTPDGYLLDFSGKKDGGPSNVRYMDHREFNVNGFDWQDAINKLGFVRMQPESSSINLTQPLTEQQKKKLSSYIQRFGQDNVFTIDLDKQFKEYKPGVLPNQVFSDLDTYFSTGKLPDANKVQYSLDNSLVSQLNLSTLIPLIEQSKQSASDYINSLNIQSDNPNVIKYLETMSNFVRDYNPDLRYDTIGNLTTQAQEDDFNLRENGKLKVYYYDENAINDNAISYGHFLTDNPIGLENPKQVYVKANLVDANGTELSQLDELYEDMTNSDILKQYGSEELLNRVKTELGIDGLQFDGSVMVFSEEQFKSTEIKPFLDVNKIESVTFKKYENKYWLSFINADGFDVSSSYSNEELLNVFGQDIAKTILNNAREIDIEYKLVDSILSKPNRYKNIGSFTSERDDNGNQLTKSVVEFNRESKIRQKDGTLKVLYHGTPNKFEEFSYQTIGKNGIAFGKAFYFTDYKPKAYSYAKENGEVIEVYLNIKNYATLFSTEVDEQTRRKLIESINELSDGTYFYNTFNDVDSVYNKVKNMSDWKMIKTLLDGTNLDTEESLRLVTEVTGIDGFVITSSEGLIYMPFFPEQIKSINNPNPTNDRRIQYSIELDSINQQQIEQAKLNSTNNFSDARSILNDGTLTTSDSVPLESVLLNPLYNQAIINKMPTKAQKEQLQAFYLDTLARSGDTIYLELHNNDKVVYLKYPVVSDLSRIDSDIAKFYEDDSQRKEFFKDSKVRDEQGNLLTVYHGTKNEFNEFDINKLGSANFNMGFFGQGFYFTESEKDANMYAGKGGNIVESYLNIKNPFIITNTMDITILERLAGKELSQVSKDIYKNNPKVNITWLIALNSKAFTDNLKKQGYDGVIYQNDGIYEEIVAFYPNQIKRTDNLTPTLSNDIRYSIEDERIRTQKFSKSVLESNLSKQTQDTIEKQISEGTFNSVVVADRPSIERALAEIGEDVDKAYNKFKAKIDSGLRMTKDDLVIGQLLIKKLEKSRQTEKVVSLVQDVALLGTELGQQVQALYLIKRMSAEGKLMMMQKTVARLQDVVNANRKNKPYVKLEIPKEYQEFFVEVGARTQELEEQRVQLGQTTEELKTIEREIDSLLLSNVGSEIDTLSRELSELRALEKEESRLVNLVEQLQNRASSLSSEDIDLLQEDARILREQINAKQGSLNEIKQKQAKLSRLESQLAKVQQGESLFLDYSIEENKKQIDEYQSRINEINKQKRKYANLESTLERLSGVDPNVIAELNAKVKVVRKAERLLKKLVKENERFTSKQNVDDILDEVKSKIAEQLPVTLADKINAWRYLSMLGNPRTHVRNFLGNAFVMPMSFFRDVFSVGMQQFIPQEQRTRALFASKESIEFAKNDYQSFGKDIIEKTQKYDVRSDIERRKKIFNNKPSRFAFMNPFYDALEWAKDNNYKALEKEDEIYVSKHYIAQMSKYLTAQNIDLNTITDEQLENARQFAILEAKKMTFKQNSKLVESLKSLSRQGKIQKFIVDANIPFLTPINILKMGVEYSPIGLMNGIYKLGFDVRKGKVTAAQAIDMMSAGLTGTGIALVGMWAYSMGFIEIGGDDDETKRVYNYKNSLGRQNYSLKFGDGSYSIDWIAPAIMPFIMGAEMARALEKDGETSWVDAVYEGSLRILDPIFELSMLQGITSTLQSFSGTGPGMFVETATSMASNYFNQFIPTLLGQISRTIDPIQRSTIPNAEGFVGELESIVRRMGNKTPFSAMMNAPVIDVKGQPISSDENPFMRAFMNLFSPGYYKTDNTTEIDEEILRLYELTENTNVLPKATPTYFTRTEYIDGEKQTVTYQFGNKEYSQFGQTMGKKSYELLGKLTRYDLDDDTKVKVMSKIYEYAYELAKDEYLKNKGIENENSGNKEAIEAELKGIPTLDYLIAKTAFSTMSGEDKQETFQKFLDENGFDDDLMEIVGGYKPSSSKLKTKGLKKLK